MMLMADDSLNFWSTGDFAATASAADFLVGDDGDLDLSIDLDSFYSIIGENPSGPLESSPEDNSFKNVSQGGSVSDVGDHENSLPKEGFQEFKVAPSFGAELRGSLTSFPSYNSEASDSRTWGSDVLFESAGNFDYGKLELSAQISSPVNSCSASLKDWMSLVPGHDTWTERVGVPKNDPPYSRIDSTETQYEIPKSSTVFSFPAGDTNPGLDFMCNLDLNHVAEEPEIQFRHVGGDIDSKYTSHSLVMGNSDVNLVNYGVLSENSIETLGSPEKNSCTSMEISSYNAPRSEPSICQVSDVTCETSDHFSAMQYSMCASAAQFADPSRQYFSDGFTQFMPSNEEMTLNIKDEEEEFSTGNACLDTKIISETQLGRTGKYVHNVSMIDYSDIEGPRFEDSNYFSSFNEKYFSNASGRPIDDLTSTPSTCTQSYMSSQKQEVCIKDERNNELVAPKSSVEGIDEAGYRFFTNKESKNSLPGVSLSLSSKKHVVHIKDEKEDVYLASKRARYSQDINDDTCSRNLTDGGSLDVHASEQSSSPRQQSTLSKKQLGSVKDERECTLIQPKSMGSLVSKFSPESSQSNSSDHRSHVDDDTDVCILEDISVPPRSNPSAVHVNSLVPSQRSTFIDPLLHMGVGGMRLKANDERLIFRVALQDLSQPKSEASPPDGFLAVPLLRHQRIALSWMVQKETASLHCSGGILADDQGLGKTISTIALILKERSPSSRSCEKDVEQGELETLNLDEDDEVLELDGMKSSDASVQVKGRPAAGTLVVCPTSVLRQWADELHNKVTSEANLSVLVYHGSNRTKDPCELAKYDVVLTTYSIVSMEVPKQPLVDKDDDEKGKPEAHVVPSMGLSSSKKRKYPPSADKRGLKDKKGMDSALLESVARPLARVGWFRVVLDEAQSIKNHRTQVARACWGLRAKRRWCLSGTPIQNAVDDLYSYFRFLRYDPYAIYKLFCSSIKVPINRNPANGYKKLQAVLKTIMLRRTKGTLLDGEPIINLPPKSVELKKVDFSKEERDFYSRLEADSRAQFEVYAAAGTVKQNYVNILLMLLRLRQACDHPLLVKGYDSNSVWRTSVETAKKLPREKQIFLLNCLEASLAICGICNDPPEDAVVSICGHVFCNQCICEHLTGDDTQCPTTNCKVRLCLSAVFSKAALKSSLSDQSVQDSSFDCSGSELVEAPEPCSVSRSFDSSKIKAALEVLQSLSKPQDCTSRNSSLKLLNEITSCPESSSDPHSGEVLKDIPDKRNLVVDEGLNDSIKVVGEKAIVFSQWTRMLDLLEDCLKNSSIQYRRLDGTMSVMARDKAVKDFNTLPEVSVMIMSLKAASLGLNMVAACHVLLLDLWWNPTTEDQAIDRAHRIGQTRPVTVLRLTVKDTVEDRILALQVFLSCRLLNCSHPLYVESIQLKCLEDCRNAQCLEDSRNAQCLEDSTPSSDKDRPCLTKHGV
ncbi:hypothetical protein L1049_010293 [Liquidambar formosana]|uniref:Helicase-like transcription factor CHR28 n=1 Tax=Liquidambar formosana TaxID=63359 RepID=A0AAP0R6Z7_LIQFO